MLRILTYHRVTAAQGDFPARPLVSAARDVFERQLDHLVRKYRTVSMEEVLEAAEGRGRLPGNAVLLTFDDAYRDFAEIAWPALRSRGLPATLFVPTGYPDRPAEVFWWDRLYRAFLCTRLQQYVGDGEPQPLRTRAERIAGYRTVSSQVKALPHAEGMALADRVCRELGEEAGAQSDVLSWAELRRLANEGATLGAHTRTHPLLTRLPSDRLREEMVGSQQDLERQIGRTLPIFCYPGGAYDRRALAILKEEGFLLGFTTLDGHNDLRRADPLQLRRTNITTRTTLPVFRFRMLRHAGYFDRWRHRGKPQEAVAAGLGSAVPGAGKVAYIMSRFPKITETFILDELVEQKRQGRQIEIYPLLRERQAVHHPEVETLEPLVHFRPFLSLPILRANWHFLRHSPRRYFRVVGEVVGQTFGNLNFFVGGLGILPKSVGLAYEMERTGVSHVHAHFATHPTVAALIIHRLTGIPFSFTAHGSDLHVDQRMLDRKLAAAAFAITVSKYNKAVMVRKCGEASGNRIHVIHCGVDTGAFSPGPAEAGDGVLRLLSIGSLEEVKGHQFLVEACRILDGQGVPFECRIVGEGRLRPQLREQIERHGLAGKVRLEGALPRPEVRALLSRAQVFVLASVPTPSGKREGIPVALMEAMACGLPVVSSRLSGIPELVEDGMSGVLCEPGDAPALAEALLRLHRSPSLRRGMGQSGRERILEQFSLTENVRRRAALMTGASPAVCAPAMAPALTDSLPQFDPVGISAD